MDSLLAFDIHFSQILRDVVPHVLFLDFVFRTFSAEGITVLVWIICAGCALIWEITIHRDHRHFAQKIAALLLVLIITIGITSLTINMVWKPLFGRLRPYQMTAQGARMTAIYCPLDGSFPSGHAASALAGVVVLCYFDHNRKRHILYSLIATLICYSRIYLDCHYLGDVIGGALYGCGVAWVALASWQTKTVGQIMKDLIHSLHQIRTK